MADLGIIGAAPKDVPEPVAPKVFGAKGTPQHWTQQELEHFLASETWTEVEILTRRRIGHQFGGPEWIIKARKPKGQEFGHFWHYQDDEVHITVSQNQYRNPRQGENERIWGPNLKR